MTSKIHYRKLKNGRQFFRIEGTQVTQVLLKEYRAMIDHMESALHASSVLSDENLIRITEQDFNKAHSEALAVCQMKKIPG